MRKLAITFLTCLVAACCAQAHIVEEGDTLYLNYKIALGEFGESDEGLMIYVKNNETCAKGIRYHNASINYTLKAHFEDTVSNKKWEWDSDSEWEAHLRHCDSVEAQAILEFYRENKNDYTVLKSEWVLDTNQCNYVAKTIEEIRTKTVSNAISNASEHYAIITNKESFVYIDRGGSWNKFSEIKKVLDIEQQRILGWALDSKKASTLNHTEGQFFNMLFQHERGDFDFCNKRLLILTGSKGKHIEYKDRFFQGINTRDSLDEKRLPMSTPWQMLVLPQDIVDQTGCDVVVASEMKKPITVKHILGVLKRGYRLAVFRGHMKYMIYFFDR